MWINAEFTTQLLDAFAFPLVTPEFLGEQKLAAARSYIRTLRVSLVRIWNSNMTMLLSVGIFAPAFLILLVISLQPLLLPFVYELVFYTLLILLFVSLAIVPLLFGVDCILALALRLVVRRVMFSTGVILFFVSRAIAAYHAWGKF
jgi:hypothetical protein